MLRPLAVEFSQLNTRMMRHACKVAHWWFKWHMFHYLKISISNAVMKNKLDLEIVQISEVWQNDLPKWLIRSSRPTCLRVLPVEALVGTHYFTQIDRTTRCLTCNCSRFKISWGSFLHTYTRPVLVHRGEARVNNEFWILRIHVWVGTGAWFVTASVPVALYASHFHVCEFQVLHTNNIESLSLNKLLIWIVNSCII